MDKMPDRNDPAQSDAQPNHSVTKNLSHSASRLKNSLHGAVFQFKLLMLFAHRARINQFESFRIASEMNLAEKFDDLVFLYRKSAKENQTWRFLQAKHRLDIKKSKIGKTDLMSNSDSNSPYSLQKYFVSFCKITTNQWFEFDGADMKDFLIVTNTEFEDDCKGIFDKENDLQGDEILWFDNKDFHAKKWKLNTKSKTHRELFLFGILKAVLNRNPAKINSSIKEKLKSKVAVCMKMLMQKAVDKIHLNSENKDILFGESGNVLNFAKFGNLKINNLKKFRINLRRSKNDNNVQKKRVIKEVQNILDEAIVAENRANDILKVYSRSGSTKYEELEREKEQLIVNFNVLQNVKKDLFESETIDKFKNKIHGIGILSHLLQNFTNLEKIKEEFGRLSSDISLILLALDDVKFEAMFDDFLNKFHFVTNYPNESDLSELISHELGEEFDLLQPDLLSASFEKEMLDFLMNIENGMAKDFTSTETNELFENLKCQMNVFVAIGLSETYISELVKYGLRFENSLESVNEFVTQERSPILHISSMDTRLSAIKVHQTIEDCKIHKKIGSTIFTSLDTLTRNKMQYKILNAFGMKKTHHLLVIECQNISNSNELLKSFLEIVSDSVNNRSKKIIFIAPNTYSHELVKHFKNISKEEHRISFADLNFHSKMVVLAKKVIFQGNHVELNQLIDTDLAVLFFSDIILSQFLDETNIEIGNEDAFNSVGYVGDYYIRRKFRCQFIIAEILNSEELKSELFFITSFEMSALDVIDFLKLKEENFQIYEQGKKYEKGIVLKAGFGHNLQNVCEIFQKLGENAHWLHCGFHFIFWKASKNNSTLLFNYIENDFVHKYFSNYSRWVEYVSGDFDGLVIFEDLKYSEYENIVEKVVIVANDPGMGKSTVLTRMAREMKGFYRFQSLESNDRITFIKDIRHDRWIVRINLNNFSGKEHPQCLDKINFCEDDTDESIEFVTKMVIPGDPINDYRIRLQQNLFRLSLKEPVKKPRIVIFFDGFDEICPGHKDNTTKLIKALKSSQVAQIWITTRFHEKDHLERQLQVPAFLLMPFTISDQMEFSNKFWRWHLRFQNDFENEKIIDRSDKDISEDLRNIQLNLPYEDFAKELQDSISRILHEFSQENDQNKLRAHIDELDFSKFIRNLNDNLMKSINKDKKMHFTDNPLQLKMLSDVIFSEKFRLPMEFGLIDLYDKFIEMKFDIYFKEKEIRKIGNPRVDESCERDLESFRKTHSEFALLTIFPEKCNNKKKQKILKKIMSIAQTGLLCSNGGQLKFVHRSYAEYFLSKYFIRKVDKELVQELLVSKILIEDDFKLIRQFFNGFLEKNPESADLKKITVYSLHENMTENKKPIQYTIVDENFNGILVFLLNLIQNSNELCGKFLTKTYEKKFLTHKKELTILQHAIRMDRSRMVKPLLEMSSKLEPEIIQNEILRSGCNESALLMSITNKNVQIIKNILNFMEEYLEYIGAEFFANCIFCNDVVNAFQKSAKDRNFEAVRCILGWVKNNFRDYFISHLSISFNSYSMESIDPKLVAEIINCIKEEVDLLEEFVLKCDRYGKPIVFRAIERASIFNKVKEFAKIHCENLYDDNDLEDLALLSVCRNENTRENFVQRMLNFVNEGSNIHTILLSIQKSPKKVEDIEQIFYERSISPFIIHLKKDIKNVFPQYWQQFTNLEIKTFLLRKCSYIFLEAVDNNRGEIIDELFEKIKNYPKICEHFVIKTHYLDKNILQYADRRNYEENVLKLLSLICDCLEKTVLKKFLLELIYHCKKRSLPIEYIVEWVQKNASELIEEFNDDWWLNTKIRRERGTYTILKKWITIKNHPEISKELALRTNYFGKSAMGIIMFNDELRDDSYDFFLYIINKLGIHEDLVILYVYADARNDPERTTEELLHRFRNEAKSLEEMFKQIDSIKNHLNSIQEIKLDLDEAIRDGLIDEVDNILSENRNHMREILLISSLDGQTALHVATEYNQIEIAKKILQNAEQYPRVFEEILMKIDRYNGDTALNFSIRLGHDEMALMILNFLQNRQELQLLKKLLLKTRLNKQFPPHKTFSSIYPIERIYSRCLTINATISQWVRENLGESTLNEIVREASLFDWVGDGDDKLFLLANNMEKLENLRNYPNILRQIGLQMDHNNGSTILSNIVENYEEYKDDLENFDVSDFVQAFSEIESDDLVILAVCGDARTDPKRNVTQLLNIVGENSKMYAKLKKVQKIEAEIERKKDILGAAISSGNVSEVHNFFNQPCDTVSKILLLIHDETGQTVLHRAADRNKSQIVEFLLEKISEYPHLSEQILLKVDRFQENTALHRAAQFGHHETVRTLLTGLVNLKMENCVKMLLRVENKDEMTALKLAYKRKHHQTAKVIFEFIDDYLPDAIQDHNLSGCVDNTENILEWTDRNDFSDLQQRIFKHIEPREELKFHFFKAVTQMTRDDASHLLNFLSQHKNNQLLKELLLETNNDFETIIDLSTKVNNFKALDWIKNHFEDEFDFLTKFVLIFRYKHSVENLHFLEWLKTNFNMEIVRDVLFKLFYGTILGEKFDTANEILEWVMQNCDKETFKAMLLEESGFRTNILELVTLYECPDDEITKILLKSLEYHKKVFEKLLLKPNRSYSDEDTVLKKFISKIQHYQRLKNHETPPMFDWLKSECNKLVRSLLVADTNLSDFNGDALLQLQTYTKDCYDQEDKQAILQKIEEALVKNK